MHMAGGVHGGRGMHVHPVHPPWVRPWLHLYSRESWTSCSLFPFVRYLLSVSLPLAAKPDNVSVLHLKVSLVNSSLSCT
jgi:hypothetical protein